jgi:hypothetical protein
MYKFEFKPYSIVFKRHDNGVIAILSHENFEKTAKVGINEDNNVYKLNDFKWEKITVDPDEEDSDMDGSDMGDKPLYVGPDGLVWYIFDRYMAIVDISDDEIDILIRLVKTMLDDKEPDWLPTDNNNNSNNTYTFNNGDIVPYNG